MLKSGRDEKRRLQSTTKRAVVDFNGQLQPDCTFWAVQSTARKVQFSWSPAKHWSTSTRLHYSTGWHRPDCTIPDGWCRPLQYLEDWSTSTDCTFRLVDVNQLRFSLNWSTVDAFESGRRCQRWRRQPEIIIEEVQESFANYFKSK